MKSSCKILISYHLCKFLMLKQSCCTEPVMRWGSGCEFTGAQLDSHHCLPMQEMFLLFRKEEPLGGELVPPSTGTMLWDYRNSLGLSCCALGLFRR